MQPIGIRRWRLQKALYDAVVEAGIPVHFAKRTCGVNSRKDGLVEISFEDGTHRVAHILFGADGTKSKVRETVAGVASKLNYTGNTCLMGISTLPRSSRGICFPSASTTKCHAVFFPTGEKEQCFQFHFPTPPELTDEGSWGQLTEKETPEACHELAQNLRADGWDEKYLAPLDHVTNAIRIGFCLLEPGLEKLVYGEQGRIVLLGDAAHPPVPYIGQGAQQGLEDAGVLALVLQSLCVDENKEFKMDNFAMAMKMYEKIRLPRVTDILEKAKTFGQWQQKRANTESYKRMKEEMIQRDVFYHETLPIMKPGATYDYKAAVTEMLKNEPVHLTVVQEEQ